MDWNKMLDKIFKQKQKKVFINMVILLLCGVLLILIGDITTSLTNSKKTKAKNTVEVNTNAQLVSTSSSYEEKVKKDLTDILSQMEGVGKVSVMIYFEGGSESVPAVNVNDVNKKIEEKDTQGGHRITTENSKSTNIVIISESGGNKPFVVKQVNPAIGGVVVVAEGASIPHIRENLQNAVKTVLNIPIHKVSVVPMKRN
ncbi:stage III sporulation protein AG [Fervidicella metallireducens AeB]|uniref:Stage III sporulation protein AG n=1 Tax=Fervidicella metallireducens AeB TaxID=1403537 RepID=A0A017S0I9_9CLOT|nr:stage III sporulation protein AG [Fervidicella metallireducens]EYE89695.1 stage III sporulation protein AG [Fervidicella metallireducens AeB]